MDELKRGGWMDEWMKIDGELYDRWMNGREVGSLVHSQRKACSSCPG